MLGLNISASFNSAVTIYILIPLLIIPQLLLSGVVISFDKFNPKVTSPVGVPLAGEMMASRWAFEAFMVTQYRDNRYEKKFYDLDQTIANSEYKRVYYIPALESKLAYCLNNRSQWRNNDNVRMKSTLALIRDEISNELKSIGEDKFPQLDRLAIGRFDSTVYHATDTFFQVLRRYYGKKITRAAAEKEKRVAELTSTPDKTRAYEQERLSYTNDAVTDAVLNVSAVERIIEYNGRLYQKIYPIYLNEHNPKNIFDFSANLYQPTKYFAGVYWDTLFFNIGVIWSMTFVLFITLYFDVLKKIVRQLEGSRRFKRRLKE
jgi:hypothetical protein